MMVGEILIDFCCSSQIALLRQESGVSVSEPQAVFIIVIRGLQASLGLRSVSQQTSNQARVIIAKCEHRRVSNAVERVERATEVRLSRVTPGGKKRRRHVTHAHCVSAGQVGSRGRELSLLDVANCHCETGKVVIGVAPKEPFAKGAGARLIPVGQSSGEGALKEIGISRVYSESFPVVDLRGRRVPISACDKSRKIISGLATPNFELFRSRFGLDSCGNSAAR